MLKTNSFQSERDFESEINELIEWFDHNSNYKEDNYVKANLQLIVHLAENLKSSEDYMFISKIIDTFCEIIKIQRELIQELENMIRRDVMEELDNISFNSDPEQKLVTSCVQPSEGFVNDEQIEKIFSAYMKREKRALSTVSDYVLRVQNVWKSFYSEYREGKLPNELSKVVIDEEISLESPLLNAYHYIKELNIYIHMKIVTLGDNRNWTNNRAALNMFGKALFKDQYQEVRTEQTQTQRKDFSKYLFDGRTYGKSRLVLAVVKKYVDDCTPLSFDDLRKAFPDDLQGSLGVVRNIDDISDKYKGIGGVKRYFVNEDEIIRLPSQELVIVCTQWGVQNTEKFVEYVIREYGYDIKKTQE